MSFTGENGMVMPVSPMGGFGGGYGYDGGFGSIFWLIIIFVIAMMNGGWGFGNGFGGNGAGGVVNTVNNDVQRGFDQQATMGAIGDVNAAIVSLAQAQCQSFANVEVAANARQMALMQQMNGLSSQFADCCCENRLAVANLGAQIAQDGAATRANADAKVQAVMDKLCQLELDGIKQNYENTIRGLQNQIDGLRTQVTNQGFNASQVAQTAQIMADNAAQTAALEQYLNPAPIPAYTVQNPNCCPNNRFGCPCGA